MNPDTAYPTNTRLVICRKLSYLQSAHIHHPYLTWVTLVAMHTSQQINTRAGGGGTQSNTRYSCQPSTCHSQLNNNYITLIIVPHVEGTQLTSICHLYTLISTILIKIEGEHSVRLLVTSADRVKNRRFREKIRYNFATVFNC